MKTTTRIIAAHPDDETPGCGGAAIESVMRACMPDAVLTDPTAM